MRIGPAGSLVAPVGVDERFGTSRRALGVGDPSNAFVSPVCLFLGFKISHSFIRLKFLSFNELIYTT